MKASDIIILIINILITIVSCVGACKSVRYFKKSRHITIYAKTNQALNKLGEMLKILPEALAATASPKKGFSVENAKIIFRNFSGKPGQYNNAGNRNFCVVLEDPHLAAALKRDGWNVRYLKPRNEEDEPQPYLSVAVRFDNFPPKIVLISSSGKTILSEEEVNILDWADIANVDLIINPSHYNVNGKEGTKAYLKSMYVTIEEDEFEHKYADVPTSAANSMDESIDEDNIPL